MLRNLASEFPAGTNTVAELDEMLVTLYPLLQKLLPAYIILGVRTLDAKEAVLRNDTEAAYWFAGADPELITALALWLLHDLVERLKRAGTVEMAGPGAVQKIPLEALLKQLKHGTGG